MKAKKALPFAFHDGGRLEAKPDEDNDCGVRAFALATGKTYAEVHNAFERNGRRSGKSSGWAIFPQAAALLKVRLRTVARSGSVAEFVAKNPAGNFILAVSGHAFALRDGRIFDTSEQRGSKKLKHAWRVG